MKLSLDSDVAIELMRGHRPHYRLRLEDALGSGASLHLSSIVLHELMHGELYTSLTQKAQTVEALAALKG